MNLKSKKSRKPLKYSRDLVEYNIVLILLSIKIFGQKDFFIKISNNLKTTKTINLTLVPGRL